MSSSDIPEAVNWLAVLPALARLHHHLAEITRDDVSPREQASRVRRLFEKKTFEGLNHVAPDLRIGGHQLPPGEKLIPIIQKQADQVLDRLMEGQTY